MTELKYKQQHSKRNEYTPKEKTRVVILLNTEKEYTSKANECTPND